MGDDVPARIELGRPLAQQALQALEDGRLTVVEAARSQGWVEVFPEMTEDERRLGQLPGFTPEQIEEFRESYAPEDLGLPTHTGTAIPEHITDPIISTPIPVEEGPNIVMMDNPHSIETVSIPEDRAKHIPDGEGRSGGHRYGTGTPGKTEFPAAWSDDDILEAIREVA